MLGNTEHNNTENPDSQNPSHNIQWGEPSGVLSVSVQLTATFMNHLSHHELAELGEILFNLIIVLTNILANLECTRREQTVQVRCGTVAGSHHIQTRQ